MLRPLALLKGYIHLFFSLTDYGRPTEQSHRYAPTFTQDKSARNIPRKRWRAEGSSVGQRQTSTGAAAGTIERHREAAAITIQHVGVHRGHTCPLCVFLVTFCTSKKPPGAWGAGSPHELSNRIAAIRKKKYFVPTHPTTDESTLHRPDAFAQAHLRSKVQKRQFL